jgi:isopentenyl-diphosphate Delta-isomerase
MDEKFLVVNDKNEPMLIVRGKDELHDGPDGKPYKHRAVHVLVEVFGGKFVIQKKGPSTENAGKWSSSASGHVRAEENYISAARRELYEELGLSASVLDLFEIGKIPACEETGNEFVVVFGYLMDPDTESIRIDPEEVESAVIVKTSHLIIDVHKNPDKYSKPFVLAFNKLIELGGAA